MSLYWSPSSLLWRHRTHRNGCSSSAIPKSVRFSASSPKRRASIVRDGLVTEFRYLP